MVRVLIQFSECEVRNIRKILHENGNDQIKIITKVERPRLHSIFYVISYRALQHLDEIIKESDAIMVARGDLGVEIPPNEVPPAQVSLFSSWSSFSSEANYKTLQ